MGRFGTHPYLSVMFWMNPEHHYWERDVYSEETKERMRKWLAEKVKNEKNLFNFQEAIKSKTNV